MEINVFVGMGAAICGIVFGYAIFSRNKKSDDRNEGEKNGILLTEIGYIKSGVDDIKREQKEQQGEVFGLRTDLTAVEESAKQAHKRIDRLEGQKN